MTGTNPFEGGNPFDAFVRRRVSDPSSTGNHKLDTVLKRMEDARLQAEKQRELAHAVLTPPAPSESPVVSTKTVASSQKHTVLTGHQIWIILCLGLWAFLTLAALCGNVVGGIILSLPFFWGCMLLANLPKLFAFGPVRRNSNGKAV